MPGNNCDVYSELYPDPATSPFVIASFAVLYAAIFFMGIVGNLSIIYVTMRHRRLQTVQNMFILNLAASDVVMCLLSLPITPVTNIFKNWFFGSLLCRLIPWVQGVSVFISTFSLGAIALDRYVLVTQPHSRPLTRQGALIVAVALWCVSIVATFPYAVFMRTESYPGVCGEFCTEKWPNATSRRAYTLIVMVAQFVLPFSVMAFCYSRIFARLQDRAKIRLKRIDQRNLAIENGIAGDGVAPAVASTGHCANAAYPYESAERQRQQLLRTTRRTTVILASMVVIFGLTWLPHNLVSLIIEYDDPLRFFHMFGVAELDISYLVNLFSHCLAMVNNVANPFLYAWLNPAFRKLVTSAFRSSGRGWCSASRRHRGKHTPMHAFNGHPPRGISQACQAGELPEHADQILLEAVDAGSPISMNVVNGQTLKK